MRATLLTILIAAVFTPSLMCGMEMCTHSAKAAQSGAMPCHGDDSADKAGDVMMLKDCMGLELMPAQADNGIQAPVFDTVEMNSYAIEPDMPAFAAIRGVQSIRGPPGLDRRHASQPFTLLTTQRFRI